MMYLLGIEFELITDHRPLEFIFNHSSSKPVPRIERWSLLLQSFRVTMKYKWKDLVATCKEYADARHGARESEVKLGDEVLLTEEDKGKLSCSFGNDRHVVTSKQGSDIVCENRSNGKVTRHNSAFVKAVPKTPSLNKNDSPVGNANTQQKPQHGRKQPDWYEDVVIHALDE